MITRLEAALRHDRVLALAALVVATGLSWWWIVAMGVDMYGPMTGASAWMMTSRWDASHVLLLLAMWSAMMTAMMLPSAAPMLLVYGGVVRRSADAPRGWLRVYILAAGYVVTWAAFSIGATALQRILTSLLVLNPMMEIYDRAVGGALLLAAGGYQLTPLKRQCLTVCRSPIAFVTRYWRPGNSGAFRMGLVHGAYCLGCCWALMLLLFVGGVMNLLVIGALTLFVLIEKLAPFGAYAGRAGGVLLVAAGIWMMISA